ncbi:T9SS type A sorting domain-containing protein [Pontibacter sp. G13]|uniref:T9SS type A sorting domain-containing protein n=1 Tax=Pontibacter sp. G13 TaxID=3074898 RepID=UPI00288C09B0|nr:T9SS type A sorting domain-containing protein [Pontibacter sp. G13]WNJ20424.1 T9SS type A sorting domain-containing protein [Pontibacter sp. G13]
MTYSIFYKKVHVYVSLCFLMGFLSVANTSYLHAQCSAINFPGGRIAMSFDGNDNDADDIVAMPMCCAILQAAGLTGQVVHLEYSNHIASNDAGQAADMETSITGCINRFGIPSGIVYNGFNSTNAARNNLADEISASTANDPLWIIAAGPMETIWRAFDRAVSQNGTSALQHVTVISHSPWNENYTSGSSMPHDWSDLKSDFGNATFVESNRNCQGNDDVCTNADINDNGTLCNQNCSAGENDFNTAISKWNWLTSLGADYTWLFNQNPFGNKFDPSDAGMVYYLVTGGPDNGGCKDCGWPEVKDLFENPCTSGGGSTYFFLENKAHTKYLQCMDGADGTGSGNNTRGINTNKTGTWTQWTLVDVGGGEFRIENNEFGLWLQCTNQTDATDGQPNATNDSPTWAVRAVGTNNTGNQTKWRKVDAGNGYFRLENVQFGRWLQMTDLVDTDNSSGADPVQVRAVPNTKTGDWTRWREVSASARMAAPSLQDLSLYPNPATSSILIDGLPQSQTVEIFNMVGALVLRAETQDKVDVRALAPGVYFLKTEGFKPTRFLKK